MLSRYRQELGTFNHYLLYRILEYFQPIDLNRLNTAVRAGFIDVSRSPISPGFVFPPQIMPIKSVTYFPAQSRAPAQTITIKVGTENPAQELLAQDWFDVWDGLEDIRTGFQVEEVFYAEGDLELWQDNPHQRLVLGTVRVAPGRQETVSSNLTNLLASNTAPVIALDSTAIL